jgi:hypothetical protein
VPSPEVTHQLRLALFMEALPAAPSDEGSVKSASTGQIAHPQTFVDRDIAGGSGFLEPSQKALFEAHAAFASGNDCRPRKSNDLVCYGLPNIVVEVSDPQGGANLYE